MNELALFAGAGGGILGSILNGWRTVCAVEIDDYCRRVLLQRQRDGMLDKFPIWDDVRTFDGRPWRRCVDIVTGGFPCQDISLAGHGAGIEGDRSGLWREFARIVGEVRPKYVLVENSPALATRGLGKVLGQLSEVGCDGWWDCVPAAAVGARIFRSRLFLVAASRDVYGSSCNAPRRVEGQQAKALEGWWRTKIGDRPVRFGRPWADQPEFPRVAHGVANRMDRHRAIGNGQVPAVVRAAWLLLGGSGENGEVRAWKP